MAVRLNTTYEVAGGDVSLTVTIGNGQLGASLVRLGTREIGSGQIKDLPVGKGPAITGKTLTVKTVVADVNDKTNRTNVGYSLKGGKVPKDYDLEATVDQEGDSIIYRATFEFC